MDAPYARGLTSKVLGQLLVKNWLKDNALCIAEVRNNEEIEIPDDFDLVDSRIYGLAKVLFLQKK